MNLMSPRKLLLALCGVGVFLLTGLGCQCQCEKTGASGEEAKEKAESPKTPSVWEKDQKNSSSGGARTRGGLALAAPGKDAPPPPRANAHALIAGVTVYPNLSKTYWLDGPANDAI